MSGLYVPRRTEDFRAGLYNVMDHGAKADATFNSTGLLTGTDDTAAIQALLNSVPHGSTVYCPKGQYLIAGSLSVPADTRLMGDHVGSYTHSNTHTGTFVSSLGNGTTFLVTGGSGNAAATATITLATNSTVQGIAMSWPNQLSSAATPTAYPWAIRSDSTLNVNIFDIELQNAYQGIVLASSYRPTIANIVGQPLLVGLRLTQCLDVAHITNVLFSPYWRISGNSDAWTAANAVAFDLLRVDLANLNGCFAYGYLTAFQLSSEDGTTANSPWLTAVNCGADVCGTGIKVNNCQPYGVVFDACSITSCNTGLQVASTNAGHVRLSNSLLAQNTSPVTIDGTGRVDVSGNIFAGITPGATVAGTAVAVAGTGAAMVTGNHFCLVQTEVTLASTVAKATVVSNQAAAGRTLVVTNAMTGGFVVSGNN